jgi:hypothetical protein
LDETVVTLAKTFSSFLFPLKDKEEKEKKTKEKRITNSL